MTAGIERAVILARGLGTRMRREQAGAKLDPAQAQAADSGFKAMIPVGRPFLDYVLSAVADAGYKQVCLVIGPEHNAVRDYYREQKLRRLAVDYAIQQDARGTADALLAAREFTGGDEFIVMNADNYYPVEMLRTLRTMGEPGAVLFEAEGLIRNSNVPAERIRSYAYATVSAEGYLEDLIEKPDETTRAHIPANALVSMNCWRLGAAIFRYCRNVQLSPRGEYELPVAIRDAVHDGMKLRVLTSSLGVLDLSRRADIAEVAARLKNVAVRL